MAPGRRLVALGCLLLLAAVPAVTALDTSLVYDLDDPEISGGGVEIAAKDGRSIYDCLRKGPRLTIMAQMIKAVGMGMYFSNPNIMTTFFAFRDDAITEFLAKTGKTLPELLKDRDLIIRLLQYHSLPRRQNTSYWPTWGNGVKKAVTLIPGLKLNLWTDKDGRQLVYGVDNEAVLVPSRSNLVCGKTFLHVINEVLRPFK